MRYLVTGGAGAIGSRLVRMLLVKPDTQEVCIVDWGEGHEWVVPKDDRVTRHWDCVTKFWRGSYPVVFHLAAHFANEKSVENPELDLETNGLGTLHMLRWARETECERFVFAGAACSVGHEDTPYQIHKALGESYCRYFRGLGLSTTICRFHNTYGPGEVPGKYRNVIANWVWKAIHNEPLQIRGTGLQVRDFIYVDDLCQALIHAEGPGPVVIGSGHKVRICDLARMIIELARSKSKIEQVPLKSWDRPEYITPADSSSSSRSLEAGIAETIAWQCVNEEKIGEELRRGR